MSTNIKGEPCEICGTFVEGFEYRGCCDGRECGRMGIPIEPCVCSKECYEKGCNTWFRHSMVQLTPTNK